MSGKKESWWERNNLFIEGALFGGGSLLLLFVFLFAGYYIYPMNKMLQECREEAKKLDLELRGYASICDELLDRKPAEEIHCKWEETASLVLFEKARENGIIETGFGYGGLEGRVFEIMTFEYYAAHCDEFSNQQPAEERECCAVLEELEVVRTSDCLCWSDQDCAKEAGK